MYASEVVVEVGGDKVEDRDKIEVRAAEVDE
jgi:hypothetical protein